MPGQWSGLSVPRVAPAIRFKSGERAGHSIRNSVREAYGDNSLSRARVFSGVSTSVWAESTEDDQRPGRLVTVSRVETVTKINQIVRADRRMSIRMIVEAVNTDKETVR
ncbi:putative mariner transposase [Trichonephila clavipes]|nr:putative mariner transposase [Trichonephila clavipes]